AFVRSPHAHARLVRIDATRARRTPGILAILTAADWIAHGLGELPSMFPVAFSDGRPMNMALRPPLTLDRVRHLGDNVAVVIADTWYQAQDAGEAMEIEYEPLAANVDAKHALDPETPVLHESLGTNLQLERRIGNEQEVEAAMASAAHVEELEIRA